VVKKKKINKNLFKKFKKERKFN
jgi:hypothetical protein